MCYECLNPECFYEGSLLGAEDVRWVDYYNHDTELMDLRSTCPSCHEPLAIWDEMPDTEVNADGTLQKKLWT